MSRLTYIDGQYPSLATRLVAGLPSQAQILRGEVRKRGYGVCKPAL